MRILGLDFPGHDAERAEYREARENLEAVSAGITEETDEYLAANQRVADATDPLPWWLR